MKSYDYEACAYDGAIYCNACLPDGITTEHEEVMPVFADSEWDHYPCCDACGAVHNYVNLTIEGVRHELENAHQEFFYQSEEDFRHFETGSWQDELVHSHAGLDETEELNPEELSEAAESLAGWYYWTCLPGCMPDSEATGPFKTEAEAIADAAQSILF